MRVVKVDTLCNEFDIPKNFGILSIDAEGVGDKILAAFMKAGYRPSYVIYEWLGMPAESTEPLIAAGYTKVAKIGFNEIWEL